MFRRWWLHLKASRLWGQNEWSAAGALYEELCAGDPQDSFAELMLALCYEQEGRTEDALRLAEKNARQSPVSLDVYRVVVRLALANEEHDEATEYVERALALPEVRSEMPDPVMPKWLHWLLENFLRLPLVRDRVRDGSMAELEPGHRAMELQTWKRWALEYLAWRKGHPSGPSESTVN